MKSLALLGALPAVATPLAATSNVEHVRETKQAQPTHWNHIDQDHSIITHPRYILSDVQISYAHYFDIDESNAGEYDPIADQSFSKSFKYWAKIHQAGWDGNCEDHQQAYIMNFIYYDTVTFEEQNIQLYYNVGRNEKNHVDYVFAASIPGYHYVVNPHTHISERILNTREVILDSGDPDGPSHYIQSVRGKIPFLFGNPINMREFSGFPLISTATRGLENFGPYMVAGTSYAGNMYENYGTYMDHITLEHMNGPEGIQGKKMLKDFAYEFASNTYKKINHWQPSHQ